MNGCGLVTDHGISLMVLKCTELHSILACDTSFGNHSALALCSSKTHESGNNTQLVAYKLRTLHIGRCHGILFFLQFQLLKSYYMQHCSIKIMLPLFFTCPNCLVYMVAY